MICERIDWIKNHKNPYFVRELKTGYVVIGDHQRMPNPGPVWQLGDELFAKEYLPSAEELDTLRMQLNAQLDQLL